jgi:adenylate kinase
MARERGLLRISTGEIFRESARDGTDDGRAIGAAIDAGRLVSDEVAISVVRDRLGKPEAVGGFVLDGFPRTLAQAEALEHLLDHRAPLVVVDIEVPEETLVQRLSTRKICSVCGMTALASAVKCERCGGTLVSRADDDSAVIRERLGIYARDTRALVEYYRRQPSFRSVDGDQAQEQVAADIAAAIASVIGVRS